jgi:hypothetical protein
MESKVFTMNQEEYLKYDIDENIIDNLQYLMIEKNNIDGLLDCKKIFFDGNCSLMYKLNTCIPLKKYYQNGKLDDKKTINIFLQINERIVFLKDYFLLESNNLDINIDKIYYDYKSGKIKLVYVPINSGDFLTKKYKEFIKQFMSMMNVEDKHTRFINNLGKYISNQIFSVKSFNDFLKEEKMSNKKIYIEKKDIIINDIDKNIIQNKTKKEIFNNRISLSNYKESNVKIEKDNKNTKKEDILTNVIRVIALETIGILLINLIFKFFLISNGLLKVMIIIIVESLVLISLYYLVFNQYLNKRKVIENNEKKENSRKENSRKENKEIKEKIYYNSDETCFDTINEDQTIFSGNTNMIGYQSKAYLLSKDNISQEKIYIDKKTFIIGRQKENCDYYIINKKISKMHLEIIDVENELFIKDLNSTNGTFINNKQIKSDNLINIFENDIIRIANEEFVFKIV